MEKTRHKKRQLNFLGHIIRKKGLSFFACYFIFQNIVKYQKCTKVITKRTENIVREKIRIDAENKYYKIPDHEK